MALARSAPRRWPRGGLRIPGQAARGKDGLERAEQAAPDSRIRHLGVVHPPELVSAGPQEHGALQYPMADAAETRVVSPRPAHAARPTAAEEDQAAVAHRLPLCQPRQAHELLGSGGVIGKIVLTPNR